MHVGSLEKEPNSKPVKHGFLLKVHCFYTIVKSKNHKSNFIDDCILKSPEKRLCWQI